MLGITKQGGSAYGKMKPWIETPPKQNLQLIYHLKVPATNPAGTFIIRCFPAFDFLNKIFIVFTSYVHSTFTFWGYDNNNIKQRRKCLSNKTPKSFIPYSNQKEITNNRKMIILVKITVSPSKLCLRQKSFRTYTMICIKRRVPHKWELFSGQMPIGGHDRLAIIYFIFKKPLSTDSGFFVLKYTLIDLILRKIYHRNRIFNKTSLSKTE